MTAHQSEKEKHLQMIYKNNAVVAKDEERLIVVHSKRTKKPLLPFEITKEVYEQWNKRDNRVVFTDTPYNELFTWKVSGQQDLVLITDFNEIEFIED
jgi:S-adenosylmethionine:diacylglycerol 3-amino-3-carboxypropyl transferase